MKNIIVAAIIGGLVVLAGIKFTESTHDAPTLEHAAQTGSAFDRVAASRTLRCAYASFPPFLTIGDDRKLTGIMYDAVENAAKRLALKVEWTEEVSYGNINTGFMTGRYDAFCAGLWPAGTRAANTLFSRAVIWEPITVWVRSDDTRFAGIDKLNDPTYKISDIDGDATAAMVDALFPKATPVFTTQDQNIGEEILQVTTGKSDALFADYISMEKYLRNSPGAVKDLAPGKPPLIYPITIGFNQHETALRDMFDVVLGDMDRDGTIGRIVKNYLADKSGLLFYQHNQFTPY